MNGGSDFASIPSDLQPLWMIVRLPVDSSAAINNFMVATGSLGTMLPKVTMIGFSPAPRNSAKGREGENCQSLQTKKPGACWALWPVNAGLIAYRARNREWES